MSAEEWVHRITVKLPQLDTPLIRQAMITAWEAGKEEGLRSVVDIIKQAK